MADTTCYVCGLSAVAACKICRKPICGLHRCDAELMKSIVDISGALPSVSGLCPECLGRIPRRGEASQLFARVREPLWYRRFWGENIESVTLSPDASRIAVLTSADVLYILSSEGTEIGRQEDVRCISRFNSRHFAVALKQEVGLLQYGWTIRFLDLDGNTTTSLEIPETSHYTQVTDLWLSPNSQYLAAAIKLADPPEEWHENGRLVVDEPLGRVALWDIDGHLLHQEDTDLPVLRVVADFEDGSGTLAAVTGWTYEWRLRYFGHSIDWARHATSPELPNSVLVRTIKEDAEPEQAVTYQFSDPWPKEDVSLDIFTEPADQHRSFILAAASGEVQVLQMDGSPLWSRKRHTYLDRQKSRLAFLMEGRRPPRCDVAVRSAEVAVLRPSGWIAIPLSGVSSDVGAGGFAIFKHTGEEVATIQNLGPYHWLYWGYGDGQSLPTTTVRISTTFSTTLSPDLDADDLYLALATGKASVMVLRHSDKHGLDSTGKPFDYRRWRPEWFTHIRGALTSSRCLAVSVDGQSLVIGTDIKRETPLGERIGRLFFARRDATPARPAVEHLIHSVRSAPSQMKGLAVAELAESGDPQAVEELIDCIETGWLMGTRSEAARALGELGDERAVPALIFLLEDRSSQGAAIDGLAQIGEPAIGPLIAALGAYSTTRKGAVKALVRIGTPAVVPLILEDQRLGPTRGVGPYGLGNSIRNTKEAIVDALGQIGGPEAFDALMEYAFGRFDSRSHEIVTAPGRTGDEHAVESLLKVLEGSDDAWRIAAARALGRLRITDAVDRLQTLLDDRFNPDVQRAAADALGDIGDRKAVTALLRVRESEDPAVRRAASLALEKLNR